MHELSQRFFTLLQRAARLRQRHAIERAKPAQDPIRLLKLRRLGLLVERELLALQGRTRALTRAPARPRRFAVN